MLRTLLFLSALTMVGVTPVAVETRSVATQSLLSATVIYGDTLPPVGFVDFCSREVTDENCSSKQTMAVPVELTSKMLSYLQAVNEYVNTKIRATTDQELYGKADYWTYPVDAGDCEDYVLLKKKHLMMLNVPAYDLLVTVVLDENKDGHAVLTVVTDQGDLALDNRRPQILAATPAMTGYTFLKRQSQSKPRQWVALIPPGSTSTATITK